ncbi:unnamed protein product [Sphagnum compactum]
MLTLTAFISIAELPLAREWTRTLFAIHERTLYTVSKECGSCCVYGLEFETLGRLKICTTYRSLTMMARRTGDQAANAAVVRVLLMVESKRRRRILHVPRGLSGGGFEIRVLGVSKHVKERQQQDVEAAWWWCVISGKDAAPLVK